MFHTTIRALVLLAAVCAVSRTPAADEPKGEKLAYTVYADYTARGDTGADRPVSVFAFADRKGFDKAFAPAGMTGAGSGKAKAPALLPAGAFDTHLVAAVVTYGKTLVTYTVEGVTLAADGTATVRYAAKATNPDSATYACPLVVTVPKAGVKTVVFVADGKAVGTADVK